MILGLVFPQRRETLRKSKREVLPHMIMEKRNIIRRAELLQE